MKHKLKLPISTEGWIAVDEAGEVPNWHLVYWEDGFWCPKVYRMKNDITPPFQAVPVNLWIAKQRITK